MERERERERTRSIYKVHKVSKPYASKSASLFGLEKCVATYGFGTLQRVVPDDAPGDARARRSLPRGPEGAPAGPPPCMGMAAEGWGRFTAKGPLPDCRALTQRAQVTHIMLRHAA